MKADISLQQDIKRTLGQLDDIGKKVVPAATQAALNRTMDKAYTGTIKDLIASKPGLKRKHLTRERGKKGRIQKIAATRKRLQTRLKIGTSAHVYLEKRVKKLSRLVGWGRIKYTKGPPEMPHSKPFLATMPLTEHTGMFVRERSNVVNRLPIKEVVQAGARANEKITLQPEAESFGDRQMQEHATITFPNELRRQIKWRAEKLRKRLSK